MIVINLDLGNATTTTFPGLNHSDVELDEIRDDGYTFRFYLFKLKSKCNEWVRRKVCLCVFMGHYKSDSDRKFRGVNIFKESAKGIDQPRIV